MKSFFKTPLFWVLFTITSALAGIIAFYYFPQSNPIIHLDLTMNRPQAITQAEHLAAQFNVGPTHSWHAAQFETDDYVKTFVELEAGGKDALVAMIKNNLYQPYRWVVRRFRPFEQHEVLLYFAPNGTPYGFKEKISENIAGINITSAEAQIITEAFARATPWLVLLENYVLVETSQETQPSGRIDHTFTYERTNEKIGEGFYRLKIIVAGDHVKELMHTVKVPDAFKQRYAQLRSANENIYFAATIIMLLLYVIGCACIGLFILLQQRFIIWRAPLYWGAFIAALVALNIPNQLPLLWMDYNTAYSPYAFFLQQGISILYTFIFLTFGFAFIFMAAESLSRRAFGHHLQLWRLYTPATASTLTVLGYTVASYFLVPIMLCYTVLFYVITLRFFGWWVPSSALFNPNVLATYFPWLESISVSLQAGFFEECLFRALPLASAALLGNRFGKRNWWIAGAFILQAIIFGAAHASYPAQPAYARLIELLADSTLFGGVYLAFGLLPAILTHFMYDVFWFALPVFISTAPGAMANKIIITFLALIPIIIVFCARIKVGHWRTITSGMFNKAWHPPVQEEVPPTAPTPPQKISVRKSLVYSFYLLGIIGSMVWYFCTPFTADAPSFAIIRNDIIKQAQQQLQEKNNEHAAWYLITNPFVHYEHKQAVQKQHRFIWQEGGKEIYHQLLGTYLTPPYWAARFVKFEGPLIDRAEEYEFDFTPYGSHWRYVHMLPQTRPGASLSLAEAQQLALATIAQQFHLSKEQLHEVAAVADKQPQRLDWVITYASTTDYPLATGEGRIMIKIAGDEVVDALRFVHVPEQWSRTEDNHILITTIIKRLSMLATWLIVLVGAFIALFQLHATSLRATLWMFAVIASMMLFELGNAWPSVVAEFTTSQPFHDQIFRIFTISAIFLILRAAAMAVAFSFVSAIPSRYKNLSFAHLIATGISLGALFSGVQAALIFWLPSIEPLWPNYTPLRFLFSFTTGITSAFLNYLSLTILLFLCLICMNKITHYGHQRFMRGILMSCLFGALAAGLLFANNFYMYGAAWILFTFLFYSTYYLVLRFNYAMLPIITATYLIFDAMQEFGFNPYPFARPIILVACCSISLLAWVWTKKLFEK